MPTSEIAASSAASTPPAPITRLRYTIRAEGGFLAASHSPDGPPIRTTASASEATHFIDPITAGRRAAALQQLGWRDLRVVAIDYPTNRL
jgi:hypothetical protein